MAMMLNTTIIVNLPVRRIHDVRAAVEASICGDRAACFMCQTLICMPVRRWTRHQRVRPLIEFLKHSGNLDARGKPVWQSIRIGSWS